MTLIARLRSFLRSALMRSRAEREMDAELAFHLEARVDHLVAGGLSHAEAVQRARDEFGDPLRWKEGAREAWGLRLIDELAHDLRYGLRWLRRSPGFAIAAVLSLGLGIGANTAIFSLVNAVLLRLMPVQDPKSLVLFSSSTDDEKGIGSSFTYPYYRQVRDTPGVLSGVVCSASMGPSVEIDGQTERVAGQLVSGNFFDVLGVRPHLGRLFTQDDDRVAGGHPVVVLSYEYWQRRFGGDTAIIGRSIRVNTLPMVIVGVTPRGFYGIELGGGPQLRAPMAMQAEMHAEPSYLSNPRQWFLQIVGRLAPGVTRQQATEVLQAGHRQYLASIGSRDSSQAQFKLLDGSRGRPSLQFRMRRPLLVLTVMVGTLLVLLCVNVANLMLARASARRTEFGVRLALGAGRARLTRQLLVEAFVLAAAGGGLGLLLSVWGARAIATLAGAGPSFEIALDLRVLLFTTVVSALTGLLCGLGPALAAGRHDLVSALKMDGRQVAAGRVFGRQLLVVTQIALSLALVAGAGLFARTLSNLRDLDFGFEKQRLIVLTLNPSLSGYNQERLRLFYDEVIERVVALPGVRSASFGMMPLLGQNMWGSGLTLDTGVRDDNPGPLRNAVSPGYFGTVGVPVVNGREFTAADNAGAPKVALVNEAFVARYFPGASALGRRIGQGGATGVANATIVGVVRNSHYHHVREDESPFWYVPVSQLRSVSALTLHVQTVGNPEALKGELTAAIASIDNRVSVFGVKTMEQQIEDQVEIERLLAMLAAAFGVIAALVAALGLYGVMSYVTASRTRELGVRIALGAGPREILALMLRQTTVLIVIGTAAGLAIVRAAADQVRSLLFGVEPTDAATILGAAFLLIAVMMASAFIPSRRATRIDPMAALR